MNNIFKEKARIFTEENNKYFLKKSNKNLEELFEYLHIRNFNNIPDIIDIKDSLIKYKYIDIKDKNDANIHLELASLLSSLHYKTAYYKDVSKNKYREVYDKLSDKIEFISSFYLKKINEIEMDLYPSPAHYLIQRNYSVINGAINYSKYELKEWFKLVQNKTKERVVVVNNNLKLEHLIKGDKNYLTNWDDYVVDTPVLDLYKLYKQEGMNIDFKSFYEEYNKNFQLSKEELKLFYILISIPPKIEEIDNELLNTKNIKPIIKYMYKTNELIAFINSNKEESN